MGYPPLKRKTLISNRFEIEKKIGEGTFSIVYKAKDIPNNNIVAIKIEKVESVLVRESHALKKLQDCAFVSRHIHTGLHEEKNFIAMSLLGESLSTLRHKRPTAKFSLSTVLRIGLQLIKVIRGIHELGFIHRDVKPSNFVMGNGAHSSLCYAIDFGLSKFYQMDNGEVRPPRENAEFRGSTMYASLHAHMFQDLSRRDDLWSLLYLLVECIEGDLPWRPLTEKDMVRDSKLVCMKNPLKLSKGHLPEEFFEFSNYLSRLNYSDAPNYSYLLSLLHKVQRKNNFQGDELFDWEEPNPAPGFMPNGNSHFSSPSSAFQLVPSEIQSEKEISEKFSNPTISLPKPNSEPESNHFTKPESHVWKEDSILKMGKPTLAEFDNDWNLNQFNQSEASFANFHHSDTPNPSPSLLPPPPPLPPSTAPSPSFPPFPFDAKAPSFLSSDNTYGAEFMTAKNHHSSNSEKKYSFKFTGYEPDNSVRYNISEPDLAYPNQIQTSMAMSIDQNQSQSQNPDHNQNNSSDKSIQAMDAFEQKEFQTNSKNENHLYDEKAIDKRDNYVNENPHTIHALTKINDHDGVDVHTSPDSYHQDVKHVKFGLEVDCADTNQPRIYALGSEKSNSNNSKHFVSEKQPTFAVVIPLQHATESNSSVKEIKGNDNRIHDAIHSLHHDGMDDGTGDDNRDNEEIKIKHEDTNEGMELESYSPSAPIPYPSLSETKESKRHKKRVDEGNGKDKHSSCTDCSEGEGNGRPNHEEKEKEKEKHEEKNKRKMKEVESEERGVNEEDFIELMDKEKDVFSSHPTPPHKKARTHEDGNDFNKQIQNQDHCQTQTEDQSQSQNQSQEQNQNACHFHKPNSNQDPNHPNPVLPLPPILPSIHPPLLPTPHSEPSHPSTHPSHLSHHSQLPPHPHSSHPTSSTKIHYEHQVHYVFNDPLERSVLTHHRNQSQNQNQNQNPFLSTSSSRYPLLKAEGTNLLNKRYYDSIAQKEQQNRHCQSDSAGHVSRSSSSGSRYAKEDARRTYTHHPPSRSSFIHAPPGRTADTRDHRNPSDPYYPSLDYSKLDQNQTKNSNSNLNSNWADKSSLTRYPTLPKYEVRENRSENSVLPHQKDWNGSIKSSKSSVDRNQNQRSRFYDQKKTIRPSDVSSSHDRRPGGGSTNRHVDYRDKRSFNPKR